MELRGLKTKQNEKQKICLFHSMVTATKLNSETTQHREENNRTKFLEGKIGDPLDPMAQIIIKRISWHRHEGRSYSTFLIKTIRSHGNTHDAAVMVRTLSIVFTALGSRFNTHIDINKHRCSHSKLSLCNWALFLKESRSLKRGEHYNSGWHSKRATQTWIKNLTSLNVVNQFRKSV
ncbi:unnamed protein product [Dovyalis caffra]|uniref:Uncharacterized protein n=1 Tax=Dovyalis caffra TaxID=77055 RepID=A0AAV1RN44_9ROSI|nr:unnamed protein product [Dovyalis caffra]